MGNQELELCGDCIEYKFESIISELYGCCSIVDIDVNLHW